MIPFLKIPLEAMGRIMAGRKLAVRHFTTRRYLCNSCRISDRMMWCPAIFRWLCLSCGYPHSVTDLMAQERI